MSAFIPSRLGYNEYTNHAELLVIGSDIKGKDWPASPHTEAVRKEVRIHSYNAYVRTTHLRYCLYYDSASPKPG